MIFKDFIVRIGILKINRHYSGVCSDVGESIACRLFTTDVPCQRSLLKRCIKNTLRFVLSIYFLVKTKWQKCQKIV